MMNEVMEDLWIADIETVETRGLTIFDTVVSVCQDTADDNVSDDTPYLHVSLADDERSAEMWGGSIAYEDFEKAVNTVREAMDDGTVLVHCHAGQNRSAAVCAAVVAAEKDRRYRVGEDTVRKARPIINPTPVMERHAKKYVTDRVEHL